MLCAWFVSHWWICTFVVFIWHGFLKSICLSSSSKIVSIVSFLTELAHSLHSSLVLWNGFESPFWPDFWHLLLLNVHCSMDVWMSCGWLGAEALDAELCIPWCTVFGILLLAKVVKFVLSFAATLRLLFTVECTSCGESLDDGPFNWAYTEDCARQNGYNAAFLGWLGCSIGR